MTDNIFDRMLGVLWDAERSNLPHQKWELSPQAWTELCADTRWFACWNAPNDLAFGLPILTALCSKRTMAMTTATIGDTVASVCDDAAPNQE